MNETSKKNIRRSLSTLGTATVNVEKLLDSLQQKELIDDHEKDRIQQLTPKAKKFSEIYMLLVRKGLSDSFELLHDALIETENDNVAQMLKLGVTYKSGTVNNKPRPFFGRSQSHVDDDIQVEETHIKAIVDILDITIAHAEWPLIVRDMLDPSSVQELDGLPTTTPYELLFERTLQLWINTRGTDATFNALLRILDKRNQIDTAESLQENYNKIFAV